MTPASRRVQPWRVTAGRIAPWLQPVLPSACIVCCQFSPSLLRINIAMGDERFAADPGENLSAIGFNRHPSAPAVAALAAPQLLGDRVEINPEAGRHPFKNNHEAFAMRLTCGEKTQHCHVILYEVSALFGERAARSGAFPQASGLQNLFMCRGSR